MRFRDAVKLVNTSTAVMLEDGHISKARTQKDAIVIPFHLCDPNYGFYVFKKNECKITIDNNKIGFLTEGNCPVYITLLVEKEIQ